MQYYTIGTVPVPEWCRNYIMPFRKADGSTGYEFHGYNHVFNLKAGDELIKNDRIHVRRKVNDRKAISEPNKKE